MLRCIAAKQGTRPMKNPWMSLWLSEYNKATSAARGQMAAEMSRQQTALMKAWSEGMTDFWMAVWFPWGASQRRRR